MFRPFGGPPAWSPVWRRVPARFLRAGALENAAEPDRPSGCEEPPPAKTLKVRRRVLRFNLTQVELQHHNYRLVWFVEAFHI